MSAARRLKASAMNQKTFTRTSDGDGLNTGKGGGGVEGMETCGAIEDSCTEICERIVECCRRYYTVSDAGLGFKSFLLSSTNVVRAAENKPACVSTHQYNRVHRRCR